MAPRTIDQAKSKPQVMPSIQVIGEAKLRLSRNASKTLRSGQTMRPARTISATGATTRRRFCMGQRAARFRRGRSRFLAYELDCGEARSSHRNDERKPQHQRAGARLSPAPTPIIGDDKRDDDQNRKKIQGTTLRLLSRTGGWQQLRDEPLAPPGSTAIAGERMVGALPRKSKKLEATG